MKIPPGYIGSHSDPLTGEIVVEFGDADVPAPPGLLMVRKLIFDGDDGRPRWLRDLRISPDGSITATWLEVP